MFINLHRRRGVHQLKPDISLSVPVYGTERLLPRFLESVIRQNNTSDNKDFSLEVILVNDGTPDRAALHKTVKAFTKKFADVHIPLYLVEHSKNLGLVEARRSAVNAAKGEFIMFADSDDSLPPNAVRTLYTAARQSGADIVHGAAQVCGAENEPEGRIAHAAQKTSYIYDGKLKNKDILYKFIVENAYSGFLWGKLFKTDLVRSAYESIPFTYCTMAEDLLAFFFIAVSAYTDESVKPYLYLGIKDIVYNYHINTGISSRKQITSLDSCKGICSAASVFTIILSYLEEHPISVPSEQPDIILQRIKEMSSVCYHANLRQLETCVIPELQDQARSLLKEWWGR